jgi:hypothetical protein
MKRFTDVLCSNWEQKEEEEEIQSPIETLIVAQVVKK